MDEDRNSEIDARVEALIDAAPERVVAAYRRKFSLPESIAVDAQKIRLHWRIERRGTREILASDPQSRLDTASRSYTEVFSSCPWLNQGSESTLDPALAFSHFRKMLGSPRRIYEIGSGKGELAAWLADQGYDCVATEISSERGAKHVSARPNLAWHTTDGVHLSSYEAPGSFDALLSVQVVEHIHPQDLAMHFVEAAKLLRRGGRYVFTTPHALCGPADLSEVFELDQPFCHHLREYEYREFVPLLHQAGFTRLQAVYTVPHRLKPIADPAFASAFYLRLLLAGERALGRMKREHARKLVRVLRGLALWRPDVFIVARLPA